MSNSLPPTPKEVGLTLKKIADETGRVMAVQVSQEKEMHSITRYWIALLVFSAMLLGASTYLLVLTSQKFQEINEKCHR